MSNAQNTADGYWNAALREWEQSSYGSATQGLSFVEWLASYFRRHIRERQRDFLEMASERVPGNTIVELGCASGYTAFSLLGMNATKVIGFDISREAVKKARQLAVNKGLSDEMAEFHVYEIGEPLPIDTPFDLMVGLGIIEYIPPRVLLGFLKEHGPGDLFFSFDEKRWNLQKLLHNFYRAIKKFPFYIKYSQREIQGLLDEAGYQDVRVMRRGLNTFFSVRRKDAAVENVV